MFIYIPLSFGKITIWKRIIFFIDERWNEWLFIHRSDFQVVFFFRIFSFLYTGCSRREWGGGKT